VSLTEIKRAVERFSPNELAKFTQWFEGYCAELWDQQIEQDVKANRLDHLIREADADSKAERFTSL
jgi:hypothetical protein